MPQTTKLYNVEKPINNALNNSFDKILQLVLKNVKEECPEKTGALANSIDYMEIANEKVWIGSDLDYAKFVELGTKDIQGNPFIQRGIANTKVTDKEIDKI